VATTVVNRAGIDITQTVDKRRFFNAASVSALNPRRKSSFLGRSMHVWPRNMCPECVRSFVVLMKNEINNEKAKYEHADNDTGKN
jgi:hypothetical protein